MLTDTKIRSAKSRDQPYRIFDGGDLHIVVNPNGSKWWRLKYRFDGREKSLSLGVYDDTSLKAARTKRTEALQLLDDGIDPSEQRRVEKSAKVDTFESVALEWLDLAGKAKRGGLRPGTIEQLRHRLKTYAFPYIGKHRVRERAVRTRPLTVSAQSAVECFAMPLQQVEVIGTSLRICAERWYQRRPGISPRSPTRSESASYFARSPVIKVNQQ